MSPHKRPSVHIPPVAVSPAQTSSHQRRQQVRLYSDLRPASVLCAPLFNIQRSQVTVQPSSSGSTRKPAFQVFCDTVPSGPMSSNANNGRFGCSVVASLDSYASLQTVVNNKENQVPEFDGKVLPTTRPPLRGVNRVRVLGEKQPLLTGRQCVDQWDGKIPFAPCSPDAKPRRSILQDCPKARSPVKGNKQVVDPNKSKSRKHAPAQTRVNARLSKLQSHLFLPDVETSNASRPLPKGRATSHVGTLELNTLVAKLAALETNDSSPDEDTCELLEPLPHNATCPGAPKLPSTFTMPVFDAGEDEEAHELVVEPQLECLHQMSPLAEVTEAYTGLQGGWSPPIETLSPVLGEHSPTTVSGCLIPTSVENEHEKFAMKTTELGDMMDSSHSMVPRFKRRREHVSSAQSSTDHPSINTAKGLFRI